MNEIKCTKWSDEIQVGTTDDGSVYTLKGDKPELLIKEFHMNRPHWRIRGSSKRYSDLALEKKLKPQDKIIQQWLPF
jgi:hypothetical protein